MKGPIASATIRTSAVLGLRLIAQTGTLLLVARMLGPDQFGAFAGVAALAVMLGTLSTFGTHLVLLGEVAKEPRRREQVLRYALPTTLLCGGVLLLGFLLLSRWLLPSHAMGWSVLLAIGLADVLLLPLLGLIASEYLAAERTARAQLLQTSPLALRLVVAGLVLAVQPAQPLVAYAHGYWVVTAVALIAGMARMPQPWPHPKLWRWPSRCEQRESVSYAVLNITAIGPSELDKTLAARLLPLSAAGLYAAGARVVGAVTLPVVALMLSALPRLFREGKDQPQRTARLLRWVFGATGLYSLTLATLLWWCAPLFVLFLGDKYAGVDDTIRWLCLAVPGMALRIAAGNVLMALGKPWMRASFEVAGLVVLISVAILLTAQFDTLGMALALAGAEWMMALLGGWLVVRVHRQHCLDGTLNARNRDDVVSE